MPTVAMVMAYGGQALVDARARVDEADRLLDEALARGERWEADTTVSEDAESDLQIPMSTVPTIRRSERARKVAHPRYDDVQDQPTKPCKRARMED